MIYDTASKVMTTSRLQFPTFQKLDDNNINPPPPKLYGRNKELKRLRKCYNDVIQSKNNPIHSTTTSSVVFVTGVEGVGKTVLVEEFLRQPLERRRAAAAAKGGRGRQRGGGEGQQQHAVVRCQFAKSTASKDSDGCSNSEDYQAWNEIYSALNNLSLEQKQQQQKAAAINASSSKQNDGKDDDDDSSTSSSSFISPMLSSSTQSQNCLHQFSSSYDDSSESEEEIMDCENATADVKATTIASGQIDDIDQDDIKEQSCSSSTTIEQKESSKQMCKESIHSLLSNVSKNSINSNLTSPNHPLILFLDDCQYMNSTSCDVLSHLLFEESPYSSSSILSSGNVFIICAYSSTSTNNTGNPFHQFLNQARSRMKNLILNSSMISIEGGGSTSEDDTTRNVGVMNVYPLPFDVVTSYIAGCSHREMSEVSSSLLLKVIYDKTIGISSYINCAMNELIEKKVVWYDDMTNTIDWMDEIMSDDAMSNYLSDSHIVNDIINSIQIQIREQLSVEVQRILTMMACMPNMIFHASLLCELLYLEESDVRGLLTPASNLLRISSSSSTLKVSFVHELIRQALRSPVSDEERDDLIIQVFNSHFRKWNEKRMHVCVGNRVPKLRREMVALVEFFNLVDPSSPLHSTTTTSVGVLGDSHASRNSNGSTGSNSSGSGLRRAVASISVGSNLNSIGGRRKRGGMPRGTRSGGDLYKSLSVKSLSEAMLVRDKVTTSLPVVADDNNTSRQNEEFPECKVTKQEEQKGSMNSLASLDSFARIMLGMSEQDPKIPPQLCPELCPAPRRQKQALESIFFPFGNDPKSVLLQHGSIYFHNCHDVSTDADFDDEKQCDLSNERELMIFSHGFIVANFPLSDSYHLMMALSDGDIVTQEGLLEYVRAKLAKRAESDEPNQDGNVSISLLRDVFNEIALPKYENVINSLNPDCAGLVKSDELLKALEEIFSRPLSPRKQERSAEFASLFSSVARVDCLDLSHSSDPRSEAVAHSSLAERSFAITLNDRDGDLIFVCSDSKRRDSYVMAIRNGVIKAIEKSSLPDSIQMRKNRGWQHLVVRNSPISYVIDNDAEKLENILDSSNRDGDDAFGEVRFKLSELDEQGYAAIHYASFLGHARCVDILLGKAGANASLLDVKGLTPKDHAKDEGVIEILEKQRGRHTPRQRPPLTRPSLSGRGKQSSFRRLRGFATPKRKVRFADLDESTRSLPMHDVFDDSDSSDWGPTTPVMAVSMPNVWE